LRTHSASTILPYSPDAPTPAHELTRVDLREPSQIWPSITPRKSMAPVSDRQVVESAEQCQAAVAPDAAPRPPQQLQERQRQETPPSERRSGVEHPTSARSPDQSTRRIRPAPCSVHAVPPARVRR